MDETTATLAAERPASERAPVAVDDLLRHGHALLAAGRLDELERLLDQILAAAPDAPAALHLRGLLMYRTGRYHAAAQAIERARRIAPGTIAFTRDLCPIYERLGRYEDAMSSGHAALAIDRRDLQTLHNLALVHFRLLELDDAIAWARRTLAIDPTAAGAHLQLAEALLLRGEFAEGLEEYEWRYRIEGVSPPIPSTDRPPWDGSPLTTTLLLIADQGFGDSIQFSRYIPWVRERCADLVVAAARTLHPLLAQIAPGVRLVDDWSACPPFTAYCPLSGLPRLHGTRIDRIPALTPCLHADPRRSPAWRQRLGELAPRGYRRIGIVWAGRPTHRNDLNRSISLRTLAPLAELAGTALVALQQGPGRADIAGYFGRAPLINLGAEVTGFADTMGIIDALDLVIAVDTAVAHLAASMGKPVWVLLPYAPDWRWLLRRADSPWYPSMRLFRQTKPGEWTGVVDAIRNALGDG
ncbi:MAG: tetratricopeptide repeat-containing glycosyltransferase family protein [Roseiarcus sp.]